MKKQILEYLILASACLQVHNLAGMSALHLACSNGCIKCVQYLLESGADMCAASAKGETCLHLARAPRGEKTHGRGGGQRPYGGGAALHPLGAPPGRCPGQQWQHAIARPELKNLLFHDPKTRFWI